MPEADPKVIRLAYTAAPEQASASEESEADTLGQAVELLSQLSHLQVGQGEQIATIVAQLLAMNRLFERQARLIAAMQRRIDALEEGRT
jgi:hypothetical protein